MTNNDKGPKAAAWVGGSVRLLISLVALLGVVIAPSASADWDSNGVCTWFEMHWAPAGTNCGGEFQVWDGRVCSLGVAAPTVPPTGANGTLDSGPVECPGANRVLLPRIVWPNSHGSMTLAMMSKNAGDADWHVYRIRHCSATVPPLLGDQVACANTAEQHVESDHQFRRLVLTYQFAPCVDAEDFAQCSWYAEWRHYP